MPIVSIVEISLKKQISIVMKFSLKVINLLKQLGVMEEGDTDVSWVAANIDDY